jgi:hypothetical protein
LPERALVQPVEDQHLAARQQRRVQLEARVFGRRTDQRDRAVLDIGKKAVLLRAIEAVDLVDEQQGALACARGGPGFGEHFLQVGDARKDRRDGDEAKADRIGEQARDARLAGARRAPQDHRSKLAGGDHSADRSVGAGQMLLTDDIGQAPRPQPVSERRIGRGLLRL